MDVLKRNIRSLAWVAVLAGIQLVFLAGWLFTITAPAQHPSKDLFFMPYKFTLGYEHELEVYLMFVVLALGVFTALSFRLRKRLGQASLADGLRPWILFCVLCLVPQAAVMTWAWHIGAWTPAIHILVAVVLFLPVILQLKWPFLRPALTTADLKLRVLTERMFRRWKEMNIVPRLADTKFVSWLGRIPAARWVDAAVILAIVLVINVRDVEGLAAKILLGDQGRHLEPVVTAPVYTAMSGATVDVDMISQYGVGYPVVLGLLTQWLGGFSYPNVLEAIILLGIAYYIVLYGFLRFFLPSQLAAIAAIIAVLHLQYFGPEAYPYIHMNPNSSPVRFLFDGIFFLLVLLHLKKGGDYLLYVLAFLCGFSLFYLTSLGLALSCVFGMYVLITMLSAAPVLNRAALKAIAAGLMKYVGILLASFVIVTCVYTKGEMFSQDFLHAFTYQAQLMKSGVGNFRIISGGMPDLVQFTWAIVLPVFYLVIFLTGLGYWRRNTASTALKISALLALYSLCNYQHFVLVSYPPVIFRSMWPFITIVFLGVDHYLDRKQTSGLRSLVWFTAVAVFTISLWIDPKFSTYPNALCRLKNPYLDMTVTGGRPFLSSLAVGYPDSFKLPVNSLGVTEEFLKTEKDFTSDEELKVFFRKQFDFSKDAELIRSLTPPDAKVAVVSNFDPAFLAQAHRRPFFKIFPLFWSRPISLRTFPEEFFFTLKNFQMLTGQLDRDRPEYVFIQKMFLTPSIPASYVYQYEGTVRMIMHVLRDYEPYKEGEYLMALKRKAGR